MKRDWSAAHFKLGKEQVCRRCGTPWNLEAAHITERANDTKRPIRWNDETDGEWGRTKTVFVHPDRIYPLCGPFPQGCHGAEHRHEFDSLPLLHLDEQIQAVADAGGLELARRRLAPSLYGRSTGGARAA